MDRDEQVMLYYRVLTIQRLMLHHRFPPAFLVDDNMLNTLADVLPAEDFGALLDKRDFLDEEFGNWRHGPRRKRGGQNVRTRNMARDVIARVVEGLDKTVARMNLRKLAGAPISRKICKIQKVFQLEGADSALLHFFALLEIDQSLNEVLEDVDIEHMRRNFPRFVALLLGISPKVIREALANDGNLRRNGILECNDMVAGRHGSPELADKLKKIVTSENIAPGRIVEILFAREPKAELQAGDFTHLAGDLAMVARLLEDAWKHKRKGVNILLYGPPGLGKTQLARLAANMAGGAAYGVSRQDEDDDATSVSNRRLEFKAFHRFCQGSERPVLVVDEAESMLEDSPLRMIFGGGNGRHEDKKSWLTETLETNPLPVIWIVNCHYFIHEAVMRRFSYAVRFEELTRTVRARIWRNALAKAGARFSLPDSEIEDMMETYDLSPGHLTRAMDTWRHATGRRKPDPRELRQTLAKFHRLSHDEHPRGGKLRALDANYRPEWLDLAGDRNAGELVRSVIKFCQLQDEARPMENLPEQMTFLLHGPPGSGKTEWAKFLAKQADRRLQVERISDLVSKWVGETERNLARAFRKASQEKNFLLIDEFDAMGGDRRNSHY
ncbi:MAG: ATP-binding protein, partial [bacterium]